MASRKAATGFCSGRHGLACSHNPTWSGARHFSGASSLQAASAVPSLIPPPNSSPELIDILTQIRKRIFFPSYLKDAQRRLVFKQKNWNILRNETITLDFGGVNFQLEPLDRTKDIPDSWKSLVIAMKLLLPSANVRASEADLRTSRNNFTSTYVELLRGFRLAGRRWEAWQLENLVKMAGRAGMAQAVLEAVKSGPKTGVLLRDVRVVREALWACRELWRQDDCAGQALKCAEQIAVLCEDKDHAGKRLEGSSDPRHQPDCIAVLLELACVHAAASPAQTSRLEKVRTYASRLVANLETAEDYLQVEDSERSHTMKKEAIRTADYQLCRWLPARNGLRVASELLNDQMPQADRARAHLSRMEGELADAEAVVAADAKHEADFWRGLDWVNDSNNRRD